MSSSKLKKFKVKKRIRKDLPLFYNFIYYNGLIDTDGYAMPRYSEKYTSYIPEQRPDKLISKIIDFSKLKMK